MYRNHHKHAYKTISCTQNMFTKQVVDTQKCTILPRLHSKLREKEVKLAFWLWWASYLRAPTLHRDRPSHPLWKVRLRTPTKLLFNRLPATRSWDRHWQPSKIIAKPGWKRQSRNRFWTPSRQTVSPVSVKEFGMRGSLSRNSSRVIPSSRTVTPTGVSRRSFISSLGVMTITSSRLNE